MKGNQLLVAYNTGNYDHNFPYNANLKVIKCNVNGTSLIPTASFLVAGPRLYTNTSISSSMVHHAVGLRSNGEVLFLRQTGSTSFNLEKLEDGNTPVLSTLSTGVGDANLVVASNNSAFLAYRSSAFQIDLFDEHDALAHTYTPSWQLLQGLNNLAVLDCKLLAVGIQNTNTQYHEFYDCSDCQGGLPVAGMEYANPYNTISMNSYYGPQPVAVFCGINQVVVDGSSTTCESGFHMDIWEFDLVNWNAVTVLYSGWVPGFTTVPHNLKIADYLPGSFVPDNSKVYMVSIAVGYPWNFDNKFFKLQYCQAPPVKGKYKVAESAEGNLEKADDWSATIIPNPNQGSFSLDISEVGSEPIKVTILNSQGQVVQSCGTLSNKVTAFDLNFPSGMYFIQMQKNGQQKNLKFLIQ